MSITLSFEVDPTGESEANLVVDEFHSINEIEKDGLFFTCPNHAPFFETNFSVEYSDREVTQELILNEDYRFVIPFKAASLEAGKPIWGFIELISALDYHGSLRISYQAYGGKWSDTRDHIANHLSIVAYNPEITILDMLFPEPLCHEPGPFNGSLDFEKGQNEVIDALVTLSTTAAHRVSEDIIVRHLTAEGDPHETSLEKIGCRQATDEDLHQANDPNAIITHAQFLALLNSAPVSLLTPVVILKPEINYPQQGSTEEPSVLTIISSAFETDTGYGTHLASNWQIADDSEFSVNVFQSLNDSTNKTSWPLDSLLNGKIYYLRVRYLGLMMNISEWSDTIHFKCYYEHIETPIITHPANEAIDQTETLLLMASIFHSLHYDDSFLSSTWHLSTNNQFSNIVGINTNNQINKTIWNIRGLLSGTTYYARVKYTGQVLGDSDWSPIVSFTIVSFIIPANLDFIQRNLSFTIDPFISENTLDNHLATDWQLSTDPGFNSIYSELRQSSSNLTEWSINDAPSEINLYCRARAIGSISGPGIWIKVNYIESQNNAEYVITPEILSYTNQPNGDPELDLLFSYYQTQASAFAISGTSLDIPISSNWELSSDGEFTTLVDSSYNASEDITTTTLVGPNDGLPLYVRVKYTGETFGSSAWSLPFVVSSIPSLYTKTEIAKLTALDYSSDDLFGYPISISGDGLITVIGSQEVVNEKGSYAGSAYLFASNNGEWTQHTKIIAGDGSENSYFGSVVTISKDGGTVVISSPYETNANGYQVGSIYIYNFNGGVLTEETKLTGSSVTDNDYYGSAIAINRTGTVLAVGLFANNNINGQYAGCVYIHSKTNLLWTEDAILIADDGFSYASFGRSLAISGDGSTLIIGSSGGAYIHTNTGTGWVKKQKLISDSGFALEAFGELVSISGDGQLVAIYRVELNNEEQGTRSYPMDICLFKMINDAWAQTEILHIGVCGGGSSTIANTAINEIGTRIVISTYDSDNVNGDDIGISVVYSLIDGIWTKEGKLIASDKSETDKFGCAIDISDDGSMVAIGAQSSDIGSDLKVGSAYIFDLN